MAGVIAARPYGQPLDKHTSDEDDQESLKHTLQEDDQESLKANRMSLPKISSKETIENQIEENGKRIASMEKELNLKAETTILKKKDMEEEVQRNMKRIECLEKELEIRRSNKTITDIEALKKRNKELEKQLQEMDKELQEVRERLKKIEEENKKKDQRIEELEKDKAYNQSVLILMQIGTTLQRNKCKYVLGEYFKEAFYYKYGKIDHYIEKISSARDQDSAKKRRKELDKKCPWDQHLVDSLKNLKGARITIAHPELSSEKIQQATEHLKGMNIINDEMVENIMELKALWETSEDLLRRRSAPEL